MSTGKDLPKQDLERLKALADAYAIKTLTFSCEIVQQNLVAYLKEELDSETHRLMAAHLQSCDECRAEAESISATLGVTLRLEYEEEAPAIRIINSILQNAIKHNVSDIHIEPMQRGMRVRLRVDGVLYEHMKVPSYVHSPLLNRIKIMADMNIAERRLPQDGRIHVRMDGKDYDLRVSSFPFQHGEKIVMRVLDFSSVLVPLEKMGMSSSQEQKTRELLHRPRGLLLVAGATGCGKTTVAYGMLHALDVESYNVVTVEDPVDYGIEGVSQIYVNRKAGLTYPAAIRYLIECDPDVFFVGEIKNRETAEAVLEAALTGHLVISIIHGSDAVGGIVRLQNLGLDPAQLSSALMGVASQRLVRKICPECKQAYEPPEESLRLLGIQADPSTRFYKSAGCEACRYTGYYGLIGAFEVLEIEEPIRQAIQQGNDETTLSEATRRAGLVNIVQSAARLAGEGVTTLEEALRVTTDLRERRGV